jgi:hypothetical protein
MQLYLRSFYDTFHICANKHITHILKTSGSPNDIEKPQARNENTMYW